MLVDLSRDIKSEMTGNEEVLAKLDPGWRQ